MSADPAELWVGHPTLTEARWYGYAYESLATANANWSGLSAVCYVPRANISQAISIATQELRAHAASVEKRELAALAELDETRAELELARAVCEAAAEYGDVPDAGPDALVEALKKWEESRSRAK